MTVEKVLLALVIEKLLNSPWHLFSTSLTSSVEASLRLGGWSAVGCDWHPPTWAVF